jgi:hypothetical protein
VDLRQALLDHAGPDGLRLAQQEILATLMSQAKLGDARAAVALAEGLAPPAAESQDLATAMQKAQQRLDARKKDPSYVAQAFRALWTGASDAGRAAIVQAARELRAPPMVTRQDIT